MRRRDRGAVSFSGDPAPYPREVVPREREVRLEREGAARAAGRPARSSRASRASSPRLLRESASTGSRSSAARYASADATKSPLLPESDSRRRRAAASAPNVRKESAPRVCASPRIRRVALRALRGRERRRPAESPDGRTADPSGGARAGAAPGLSASVVSQLRPTASGPRPARDEPAREEEVRVRLSAARARSPAEVGLGDRRVAQGVLDDCAVGLERPVVRRQAARRARSTPGPSRSRRAPSRPSRSSSRPGRCRGSSP